MALHSLLSASKADRWMRCHGSLALCAGIPEKGTSAYAREGTGLHAMLEDALKSGAHASEFAGTSFHFDDHGTSCTLDVSDEQADAVQRVIDLVNSIQGTLFTEMRVHYGKVIGQSDDVAFGTADIVKVDGSTVHVIDAKFGRSYVDHIGNRQMLLYGIGVVDALEAIGDVVTEIVLHIAQPRVDTVRREGWRISREELTNFTNIAKAEAGLVMQACKDYEAFGLDKNFKRYLHPSDDACQWCPAAAACHARQDMINDLMATAQDAAGMDEFSEMPQNVLDAMDSTTLAMFMEKAELVATFIDACRHEVIARVGATPGSVPGWKLIVGRQGNRKWVSETDTMTALAAANIPDADVMTAPTLKSPAVMEKLLKAKLGGNEAKDLVEALTTRSAAKPTLVPESRPGEPWQGGAALDEFE